tara:strand:+ start:4032 stop:4214 length:183 start_codon:yes stop_codon:yes gene_type:complete
MNLNLDFTMGFLDNLNANIYEIPTSIKLILMVLGLASIVGIERWRSFQKDYINFFGFKVK